MNLKRMILLSISLVGAFFASQTRTENFEGFVFPDSNKDKSVLPVSLRLGESWYQNKKGYIGHLGEDFVGLPGTVIYAAAQGIVVKVTNWPECPLSKNHGWGPVVIVKHFIDDPYFFSSDDTILTTGTENNPKIIFAQYSHLSNILVSEGEEVKKGQPLGRIGTVCPYIPHMHFEIKDQSALNNEILGGIGSGYSGTDAYAPHRYKPSKFIDLNKNLVIGEKTVDLAMKTENNKESTNNQLSSLSSQIKAFFSHLFNFSKTTLTATPAELTSQTKETMVEKRLEEKPQPLIDSAQADKPKDPVIFNLQFLNSPQSKSVSHDTKEIAIVVQAKNTGNTAWDKQLISANIVGGKTKNTLYYHPTWVTELRPALLDQLTVPSKGVGTFSFIMTVPKSAGVSESTDTYTFQIQIVRQDGVNFYQVGNQFFTLNLIVEKESPDLVKSDNHLAEPKKSKAKAKPKPITPPTIALKTTSTIFFFGGGGSSATESVPKGLDTTTTTLDLVSSTPSLPTTTPEAVPTTTPEVIIPPPVLAITFPVADPFTTTTSGIMILGSFSTNIALIETNGVVNPNLIMNTSSLTWLFTVELIDTTTTFSFIGWNTEHTVSSSVITQTIIYQPLPEPLLAPIITGPTTESIFVTSSTWLTLAGTNDPRLQSVLINNLTTNLIVSSTLLTSSTWELALTDLMPGTTTTYEVSGIDATGKVSPATTFTLVITDFSQVTETEIPPAASGEALINEIGWAGTLANQTDQWLTLINASDIENSFGQFDIKLVDLQLKWGETSIPLNNLIIPSCGTLLIELNSGEVIKDFDGIVRTGTLSPNGEHIILVNAMAEVYDEIDASSGWFAGNASTTASMHRTNPSIPANSATDWRSIEVFEGTGYHDRHGNLIAGKLSNPLCDIELFL